MIRPASGGEPVFRLARPRLDGRRRAALTASSRRFVARHGAV